MMPNYDSLHVAPDSPSCTCLHQHAQLMYQLGALQDFEEDGPLVDRILWDVQAAQKAWKNLITCSRCHSPEHEKEVFLLFATSIRILLPSLQKLDRETRNTGALSGNNARLCTPENSQISVTVGNYELTGDERSEVIALVIRRALRTISSAMSHLRDRTGMTNQSLGINPSNGAPDTPTSTLGSICAESKKRDSLFLPDMGIEESALPFMPKS